jgi:hypothetical protein
MAGVQLLGHVERVDRDGAVGATGGDWRGSRLGRTTEELSPPRYSRSCQPASRAQSAEGATAETTWEPGRNGYVEVSASIVGAAPLG